MGAMHNTGTTVLHSALSASACEFHRNACQLILRPFNSVW